jgi:hypothetical protein
MDQQLLYEIAGHRLLINTPDANITTKLIPEFLPFKIDNKREVDFLFCFSGNRKVSVTGMTLTETLDSEGISFHVYRNTDGVTICMKKDETEHRLAIPADRKTIATDLTLTLQHERQFLAYFLRTAFGMASAYHRTIKIHASVIEKGGKSLVFLGKSGTGKSTHSRLWLETVPGCTLLNDDEPIVRVLDDGAVRIYGAPWSGSTPCYRNISAEVLAFVHLHQSPENRLTPIKGVNAFTSLFQSVATLRSDKENRELVISTINDILDKVPVYRLDNRPDREAVSLSESLMI